MELTESETIDSSDEIITKASVKSLPIIERQLPRNDCPEKIILVIDICKDDDTTSFQLSEGSKYSPLNITKRAVTLFLQNKHAINSNHQYALVVLHESPIWLVDFTNNPRKIINELEDLKETPTTSSCNLSQIFNLLEQHLELPPANEYMSIAPPSYIIRTIFMYGRSHCLPEFHEGKTQFETLTKNPYFFLDILYAHETPSDDNNCEKIYDLLCDLDNVGWSYIYEVSRDATKYHNLCSRLLAHPLQRPVQKDTSYLFTSEESCK